MFDDVTPRLGLPYVVAAQAQKHIPINESLARLDGLVQLAVESRSVSAQPTGPAAGGVWILPASATGAAWAGQPAGGLMRFDPRQRRSQVVPLQAATPSAASISALVQDRQGRVTILDIAAAAGVSKSTVVEAYDRLAAEGVIRARAGAGFYVAGPLAPLALAEIGPRLDRQIDPLWVSRQSLDLGAQALKPGCGWLPDDFNP